MKEFTCIVCPNGCTLVYDEDKHVCTGNRCPRGARYAESECLNPERTLCSTVATIVSGYPVISVKTNREISKKLIGEVIKVLNRTLITEALPIGSVVIPNVLNTGADIITTAPMKKE